MRTLSPNKAANLSDDIRFLAQESPRTRKRQSAIRNVIAGTRVSNAGKNRSALRITRRYDAIRPPTRSGLVRVYLPQPNPPAHVVHHDASVDKGHDYGFA